MLLRADREPRKRIERHGRPAGGIRELLVRDCERTEGNGRRVDKGALNRPSTRAHVEVYGQRLGAVRQRRWRGLEPIDIQMGWCADMVHRDSSAIRDAAWRSLRPGYRRGGG